MLASFLMRAVFETQAVFKEISKIGEDYTRFMAWVQAKHDETKKMEHAAAEMLQHPWYPHFMTAAGLDPAECAWDQCDVAIINLWHEWLASAEQELIAISQREGKAMAHVAKADPLANAETQMMEDMLGFLSVGVHT